MNENEVRITETKIKVRITETKTEVSKLRLIEGIISKTKKR